MGGLFGKEETTHVVEGFRLHIKANYVVLDSDSEGADKYKRNYCGLTSSSSFLDVARQMLKDAEFNRACEDKSLSASDTAPLGDGGLYRDHNRYLVHPYVYNNVVLRGDRIARKTFKRALNKVNYVGDIDLIQNVQTQPIQEKKESSAIVQQSGALSTPGQVGNLEQLKAITDIFFQGADKIEDKDMKNELLKDFLRQQFLGK